MTEPLVQYPALTEPITIPASEIITLDKWWKQGPDQRPVKLRYAALLASGLTYVATPSTFANDIPRLISWLRQHPDPVRKATYRTALQQAFFTDPTTPATETVTLDKWWMPAQQVIRKMRIQQPAAQVFVQEPSGFIFPSWYMQQANPAQKARFFVALQQAFATDPAPVAAADLVTLDKWYQQSINPTRTAGLLTALQQFFWTDPTTPTVVPPSPTPPPAVEETRTSGGRFRYREPVRLPQQVIDDVEALYRLIFANRKALDGQTIQAIADLVGFFAENYDGRLPSADAVVWRDLVEYPDIDLSILRYAADLIIAAPMPAPQQEGPSLLPNWATSTIQAGAVDRAMERLRRDTASAAARAEEEEEEDALLAILMVL